MCPIFLNINRITVHFVTSIKMLPQNKVQKMIFSFLCQIRTMTQQQRTHTTKKFETTLVLSGDLLKSLSRIQEFCLAFICQLYIKHCLKNHFSNSHKSCLYFQVSHLHAVLRKYHNLRSTCG